MLLTPESILMELPKISQRFGKLDEQHKKTGAQHATHSASPSLPPFLMFSTSLNPCSSVISHKHAQKLSNSSSLSTNLPTVTASYGINLPHMQHSQSSYYGSQNRSPYEAPLGTNHCVWMILTCNRINTQVGVITWGIADSQPMNRGNNSQDISTNVLNTDVINVSVLYPTAAHAIPHVNNPIWTRPGIRFSVQRYSTELRTARHAKR